MGESSMDPTNTSSTWPYRLLHVSSLTSFVRQPGNTYGTYREPEYNVLSYTWGRFEQSGKPTLTIQGINWPIPSIRPDHFTEEEFLAAIREAAENVDFLWLDIACIPQRHRYETPDAIHIRGQEIGRQGVIFGRATRAFAWLNHIDQAQLAHFAGVLESCKWTEHEISSETMNAGELARWLPFYERRLDRLTEAMDTITEDAYFSSLWTLQEAMLRRDALLVSKEGKRTFVDDQQPEDQYREPVLVETGESVHGSTITFQIQTINGRENTSARNNTPEWTLSRLASACSASFSALEVVAWAIESFQGLEAAAELDADRGASDTVTSYTHRSKHFPLILRKVWERAGERGLLHIATRLSPNAAYSAANHRTVTQYLDRIYGIEQVYGIECSRSPAGLTKEEKLGNLSLELAHKLVTMSPFLSQLFLHNAASKNSRTWAITQECEVPWFMDKFEYMQDDEPTDLCHMEVMDDGTSVYMKGLACSFTDFLCPYVPEEPDETFPLRLFCIFAPDHHIDRALFGESTQGGVRFHRYQTLSIYTRGESESPAYQTDLDAWKIYSYNTADLQVMLLGMYKSESPPKAVSSDTAQFFYGLVLANAGIEDSGLQIWDRIGVLTWIEEIDLFDMNLNMQEFEGILH